MNIYFLTYGDKKFYYSKKHLSYLANESGFFNKVISLGPEDLENDFLEKYSKLLSKKRGGGYWIWKHEIIYTLLKNIFSSSSFRSNELELDNYKLYKSSIE